MAIAFDAAAGGHNGGGGGNYDFTGLTVGGGSDRALVVGVTASATPGQVTGVVWDPGGSNQAMTKIGSGRIGLTREMTLWYLNAPASGNLTLRVQQTGGDYILLSAAAYTGVSQTGQPEANADEAGAASPNSASVTVVTANAWLVMVASGEAGTTTAGTSTTYRGGDGFGGNINAIMDSNAGVSAGSQSLQATSAGNIALNIIALAPSGGGGGGDTITVSTPSQYHTYQRNGSNQASIPITGTYTGTPTAIEASFNGGAYATIDASPAGGTFSGTLSNQTHGQGTLTVRFTNDTAVNDTVADIGIGERFIVGGDSISEGRGTNPQTYTHGSLKATVFRQDDAWTEGDDPVDTGTSDGSHWPHMLTELMDQLGVPVALVTCGTGSTDVAGSANQWAEPNSAYEEMETQAGAVGDSTGFRGVLLHLGPNASVNASTLSLATYNAALDTLAANIAADITGAPKLLLPIMGEVATGSPPDRRAAMENLRGAVLQAVSDNANIKLGPNQIEQNYSDDVHPASDAQLERLGRLWALSVLETFFSGANSRGPRVSGSMTIDAALTEITITVDRDLASGTTYGGFRVEDGGTPATISSATRTGTREITIVLSSPASAVGNVTVSFGSENDATGQTVPQSTDVTLPTGATIKLSMEPFTEQAVTSAGSGAGNVFGSLIQ